MVSRSQPASAMIWPTLRKARAHDLGGHAKALVVVEDAAHRLHAGVVGASHGGFIPACARLLLYQS